MSEHSTAIVPIETWCYMSPELFRNGETIDVGSFAEALIYYDRVFVIPTNENLFVQFLSWFVQQGKYDDMLALLGDGVLNFYHYAFASTAIQLPDGRYAPANIQDEEQGSKPIFEKRFLSTSRLSPILPHARQRARLQRAIEGRITEVKAAQLGSFIFNAQDDFHDPKRAALLVQAYLDDVMPMLGVKHIPEVTATVTKKGDDFITNWNVDFEQVSAISGNKLRFSKNMPLIAQIQCNRLVWSASNFGCDLYLTTPMSMLVGDKLYESSQRVTRPQLIIDQLEAEVEFPDVRQLVNNHRIALDEVLELRRHAGRFRQWLQSESDRDRNALIAYHNEVSKESGWTRGARKTLRLFGSLWAPAVGAVVGTKLSGIDGAVAGAVTGKGLSFIIDIASKIDENWRPVVFGTWAKERIEGVLNKK